MLLNVTVPVFNEEGCLAPNIRRLAAFLDAHFPFAYEIVIANNGSTDATLSHARALAAELRAVRIIHLEKPGRGRALKAAWTSSGAKILSYMDADLSADLAALPQITAPLVAGQTDIAVTSRLLNPGSTRRGLKRELVSRAYAFLVHAAFRSSFSDAQCGFKALTRKAAQFLLPLVEDDGWFFDTELLVLAERTGWRILDIPVPWQDRRDSRVRLLSTALADLKGLLRLRHSLGRISANSSGGAQT